MSDDESNQASHTGKRSPFVEQVENELADIAAEITALGDMIPALLLNTEDMEQETPGGIKILLVEIRKRIEGLRKHLDGHFQRANTGSSG
jgi:hypothetical protein